MDINSVNPELQVATSRSPRLNVESRLTRSLITALMRFIPSKTVAGVEQRQVRVGDVHLRVYIPENADGGGLLWIHGGGFVIGAAARDDAFCGDTARATGVTIVSVDYRLAPRHPFPAPLDDCHAGFTWMLDNAESLGLDASRLAVGGQSAGGGARRDPGATSCRRGCRGGCAVAVLPDAR